MSCFGSGFHICRCRSLPVQPESFLFGHLLVHFLSRLTDPSLHKLQNRFLGRSSRLPCFGSDLHVYRCMSLLIQRESFGCGHLLGHFDLSYRSIHKLAQKLILGRSSRLPGFGLGFHICRSMSIPIQLESTRSRPLALALCLVLHIQP